MPTAVLPDPEIKPVLKALPSRVRRLSLVALAMLAAHLTYGTAFYFYSLPRDDALPFADGFESADLRQWDHLGSRQLCCEHSARIVTDPVRDGSHALKVELHREDDTMRGNKRAEFRLGSAHFGQEYLYKISTFLPADWRDDALPVNVVQWHNVADKLLLEGGPAQPLRIVVIGDEWIIDNFWDTKPVTKLPFLPEHPEGNRLLWRGPVDKGRWVDWEIRVRWSYHNDGLIDIRKNGQTIVHTEAANTYNDFVAPYMKFGVYVPAWLDEDKVSPVRERTVYFDNVGFSRVSPSPAAPTTH